MKTTHKAAVLLTAVLASVAISARAQIIYSNDFSATGLPNASATFTLDTGNGVFNYVATPVSTVNHTAAEQIIGVAPEVTNFVVSTRFKLNNSGTDLAGVSTVGFGAFSVGATFAGTAGDPYYLADWGLNTTATTKGQLRIVALGDTTGFTAVSGDTDGGNPNGSSVVNGNTYELRLSGTYTNGILNLTLSMLDAAGIQLGSAATATDTSPLTGNFFGYRNRALANSGTRDMSYDYFTVYVPAAESLPSFIAVPASQTRYQGDDVFFSTLATGTQPIKYQWFLNDSPIPGATNTTYVFTNAQSNANFSVIASNGLGPVTSSVAVVTIIGKIDNGILTPLWSLPPGSRSYLSTSDTERGLAYNAVSNHVLLVSRAAALTNIHVLNGDNGQDLWTMDISTVAGGTFWLNAVGVADDGVVYACNLVQNPTSLPFSLYRWDNDGASVIPTVAYSGTMNDVVRRWGDTLAVRGAGTNTQILLSSETSTAIAVFTTPDGTNFNPTIIEVPDIASGDFAHGIAFGAGDTFWGKARNVSARQVSFDLNAFTASVLYSNALHSGIGPIGVEPTRKVLAGIAVDVPDNLQLFTIANLVKGPILGEQESLPTDNNNVRNSGAVSFGNNRLYILGTANGVKAFAVNFNRVPFWISQVNLTGGTITLQWDSISNLNYQVQYKGSLDDVGWINLGSPIPATGASTSFQENIGGTNRFYKIQLVQ